ncbi:hypothetical protein J41TS12_41710 [Paenibacillus antibioticophila]|uniref:Uncharacterized protein n=1 Tax=Paenibacillus antibioticophila TaxID=1274374 RepID=A0A920CH27_9BACL|nr:hypothetical protein [Paenibacillus antibioticophila]GIO39310.1 hypothetical protein J41TS12_41710 [Paenibacillus antibioticophila]
MIRPIPRQSGKTPPVIIDELSEWTRERYEIKPIIMSRSEPVIVIVDDQERSYPSAGAMVSMAGEQIWMKGNPGAFHQT